MTLALAQEFPAETLAEVRELAVRRRAEYPYARGFSVQRITFV